MSKDNKKQEIHESHDMLSDRQRETIETNSKNFAEKVANDPQSYLEAFKDGENSIGYTAGGGLPEQFGNPDSQIWLLMEEAAEKNRGILVVAGVSFRIEDLKQMGLFYSWLAREKNWTLNCIDERNLLNPEATFMKVHCKCGACAAVGKALGDLEPKDISIEDLLFAELHESLKDDLSHKQAIIVDMPEHESRILYVDFSTNPRDIRNKQEAKEQSGLAFSISLPIEYINEYIEMMGDDVDATSLYETLVNWNVQIAQNIISSHNVFNFLKDETLMLYDTTDGITADAVEVPAEIEEYIAGIIAPRNWMEVAPNQAAA